MLQNSQRLFCSNLNASIRAYGIYIQTCFDIIISIVMNKYQGLRNILGTFSANKRLPKSIEGDRIEEKSMNSKTNIDSKIKINSRKESKIFSYLIAEKTKKIYCIKKILQILKNP